ncbi:unnamed protein product, partial [Ectocarpus sp. 13 AM-2016]
WPVFLLEALFYCAHRTPGNNQIMVRHTDAVDTNSKDEQSFDPRPETSLSYLGYPHRTSPQRTKDSAQNNHGKISDVHNGKHNSRHGHPKHKKLASLLDTVP